MTDPIERPEPAHTTRVSAETPWYGLFSRGARDWLRHNDKIRDAVRRSLPELLSGPDMLTRSRDRTVQVPIRVLEHARFRLREGESFQGAGQGQGKPGDILRQSHSPGRERNPGGSEQGDYQFVLELKVDDILDWLWEELKLPDLTPRQGSDLERSDYVREGWDRRGPRARLDRRRTLKEAVKRRAVQEGAVPFSDEDLRFRQLTRRTVPAAEAVVVFALDVSGSMDEAQRKLAKTFFFFVLHGIRRQYRSVEMVFIAHTTEAWEFPEEAFFEVRGSGGTYASSAYRLCADILKARYDPSRYNAYLFYASDGENAPHDRESAARILIELLPVLNYAGYLETEVGGSGAVTTETGRLFGELSIDGFSAGMMKVSRMDDVWTAIRQFFREQSEAAQ